MKKIIGITGGIATGKTTVTQIIGEYGYTVICADKINHKIMEKETTIKMLVENFGRDILNEMKQIDRKKLGEIVFSSAEKLKLLNSILHPLVIEEINDKIKAYYKDEANKLPLILDVPLLFETEEIVEMCDDIIVIYTNIDTQIKRFCIRNNVSEEEAIKRINKQMKMSEKLKRTRYYINNNLDLNHLREETRKFISSLN